VHEHLADDATVLFERSVLSKRMRCDGHGSTGRGGDDLYVWRTFDRLIWFEKWVHEQSMLAENTSALAELENAPPLIIQVGPTSASAVQDATCRWTCSESMQHVQCAMQPCNLHTTGHGQQCGNVHCTVGAMGSMRHAAPHALRRPAHKMIPLLHRCLSAPRQAVRTASGVRVTWQPGDGDEPLLRSGVQIRWTARKKELLEADVSRSAAFACRSCLGAATTCAGLRCRVM
jgi:hypothetical protein